MKWCIWFWEQADLQIEHCNFSCKNVVVSRYFNSCTIMLIIYTIWTVQWQLGCFHRSLWAVSTGFATWSYVSWCKWLSISLTWTETKQRNHCSDINRMLVFTCCINIQSGHIYSFCLSVPYFLTQFSLHCIDIVVCASPSASTCKNLLHVFLRGS